VIPDAVAQVAFVQMVSRDSVTCSVLIKHLQLTFLLSMALSGLAIVFASPVLHFVFNGRYDGATQIAYFAIPAMAMIGFNRMIDSMLRARGRGFLSVSTWIIAAFTIACGAFLARSTGQTHFFLFSMLFAQCLAALLLTGALVRAFDLRVAGLFSIKVWHEDP
jgi:O-antigen/teichoic acid export membrane protein